MSNASRQLQLVSELPQLTVAQRRIANTNDFQFYIQYGSEPGPWVKVGVNDTEYLIGFLPQPPKKRAAKVSSHKLTSIPLD